MRAMICRTRDASSERGVLRSSDSLLNRRKMADGDGGSSRGAPSADMEGEGSGESNEKADIERRIVMSEEKATEAAGLLAILLSYKRGRRATLSEHLFNAAYDLECTKDAEFIKIDKMPGGVDVLFILLTSVQYDYGYMEHKLCTDEMRRNGFQRRMDACSEEDLAGAVKKWETGEFIRLVTI
jgi:hypothetical protein